jgi:DNA-binding NtrC family response regulator
VGSRARAARVLLVEDDIDVREVLQVLFRDDGHLVTSCETADRAMAALQHEPFDVVITDLELAGASGWDVARAVKRWRPGTPVALMTGWSDVIDTARPEDGVDFVIGKPFRRRDIRAVVAAALDARVD